MKYVKTEVDKILREKNSNALINNDINELNSYKINKKKNKKIENLESEVNDIKNLLIKY